MTRNYLDRLLRNNVVWLRFKRRHWPRPSRIDKWTSWRRGMWCTKSEKVLNCPQGKRIFGYRIPTHPLHYDPVKANTLVVWDFQEGDFRQIPCESVEVLMSVQASTFWDRYVIGGLNKLIGAKRKRR